MSEWVLMRRLKQENKALRRGLLETVKEKLELEEQIAKLDMQLKQTQLQYMRAHTNECPAACPPLDCRRMP